MFYSGKPDPDDSGVKLYNRASLLTYGMFWEQTVTLLWLFPVVVHHLPVFRQLFANIQVCSAASLAYYY